MADLFNSMWGTVTGQPYLTTTNGTSATYYPSQQQWAQQSQGWSNNYPAQMYMPAYQSPPPPVQAAAVRSRSIREELQAEVDVWLKGVQSETGIRQEILKVLGELHAPQHPADQMLLSQIMQGGPQVWCDARLSPEKT